MNREHFRYLPLILGLFPSLLLAQNEEDALRISTIIPGGTARSAGMANGFGALGADGSAIAINPAGFGVYRTTEVSLTPSLEVNDAAANYNGTRSGDTETRFSFSNLTLAINNPSRRGGDWRSSTYGIAFDRQATHHRRHHARGDQIPGSIVHVFHDELAGVQPHEYETAFPFTGSLAWETFALDTIPGGQLIPLIPFGADTRQTHTQVTRGATSNTAFFYSGNYMDRLYVGASMGIVGHRFRRMTLHHETNLDQDPLDLDSLTYREDLNTTANGLDVKIGAIGRITERFRMGLAYHSPQWLRLNEAYQMEMSVRHRLPDSEGNVNYAFESPEGVFNYRLTTPWRVVASAAYIAGPNGLFSLDYEYADMRRMRFRQGSRYIDGYDFRAENDAIATVFRPVHTVRVGTEWRTGAWYYRLGWGYSTDPYVTSDARHGRPFRNYAAGIGYRTDHVGVDLAFNVNQRGVRYYPYYDPNMEPMNEPISEELSTYRAMLTLSFRP